MKLSLALGSLPLIHRPYFKTIRFAGTAGEERPRGRGQEATTGQGAPAVRCCCVVPGAWCAGAWFLVPGGWCLVPGAWCLVAGPWPAGWQDLGPSDSGKSAGTDTRATGHLPAAPLPPSSTLTLVCQRGRFPSFGPPQHFLIAA